MSSETTAVDRALYVTVGEISTAVGVIVTTSMLSALGFEPAATFGSARFFRRDQVPEIAGKLAASITDRVREWT